MSGARAARLPLNTKSALAAAFPVGESGPSRSNASGMPGPEGRTPLVGKCNGESKLSDDAGARLGVTSSSGMAPTAVQPGSSFRRAFVGGGQVSSDRRGTIFWAVGVISPFPRPKPASISMDESVKLVGERRKGEVEFTL